MPGREETHRSKVSIGKNEVLSTWAATCPKCYGNFRLLWPTWVVHVPAEKVVALRCPFCRHSFSLGASALSPCDEDEYLAAVVVEGLG